MKIHFILWSFFLYLQLYLNTLSARALALAKNPKTPKNKKSLNLLQTIDCKTTDDRSLTPVILLTSISFIFGPDQESTLDLLSTT